MEKFNFELLQSYQSFNTIEEMDQAVRGFLYKHKEELSEGTISVLTQIWRHSVKVIGVSFARNDYLAEQANVSRRTVIRALNVLMEKGLIKKIPTARKTGKQGVNILIIQPFTSIEALNNTMSHHDDTPEVTANKTENKQSSLCEKKSIKPYNVKEKEEPPADQLDVSFLPETIPQEFVIATKPFFNAIGIYELWKRVLIVYRKMKLKKDLEAVIDRVIYAFKQTVFAKKRGKINSTFEGYFYTILYSELIVEKRREMKHAYYDFLAFM